MPAESNKIFTVKELADLLNFSTNTVYKYLDEGKIRATRLGKEGRFRIPESEVIRLLSLQGRDLPAKMSNVSRSGEEPLVDQLKEIHNGFEDGLKIRYDRPVPSILTGLAALLALAVGVGYFLFPQNIIRVNVNLYLHLANWINFMLAANGLALLFSEFFFLQKKRNFGFLNLTLAGLFFLKAACFFFLGDWIAMMQVFVVGAALILRLVVKINEKKLFLGISGFLLVCFGGFLLFGPELLSYGEQMFTSGLFTNRVFLIIFWFVLTTAFFLSEVAYKQQYKLVFRAFSLLSFSLLWLMVAGVSFSHGFFARMISSVVFVTIALVLPFWDYSLGVSKTRLEMKRSFLAILFFLVLGVVCVGVVNHSVESDVLIRMGNRADSAVSLVESFLRGSQEKTIAFSANKNIISFLSENPDKREIIRAEDALKELFLSSVSNFRRIYITSTEGLILAAYPHDSSLVNLDVSDRDYFKQIKEGQKLYISNGLEPKLPTTPVLMVLSAPIQDSQGRFLGVMATSIDLVDLSESLSGIKFGERGSFDLIDAEGKYLVNGDPNFLLKRVPLGSSAEKSYLGMSGQRREYDEKGRLVFQAFRPVSSVGWGLVAEQPFDEVFGIYSIISSVVFLFSIFLGLIVVIFINYLGNSK